MQVTIQNIYDFYNQHPEEIGQLLVDTRYGYKTIDYCDITSYDSDVYCVTLENGMSINTSPDHQLWINNKWTKVSQASVGDLCYHKAGKSPISYINKLDYKQDLYDLQVEEVHEFFANNFVSHNSTIIDAITYVLFGKAFRNINKPQLINSTNAKNMLVEIKFSTNNNKYLIRRGMKPNVFEIHQNGVLLNQSADSKDYQSIIEKTILKMNYKTFCQVVVLGSANFTPFMLLPAAQRRTFVEDLLDIQIFTTMNGLLKDRIAENKTQIIDCDMKIKLVESSLETNKKHREKASQDINSMILHKEEQISELNKDVQKHLNEIDAIKIKTSVIQKNIDESRPKNKKALDKAYNMRTVLTTKISNSDKSIVFFQENNTCPTCEQQITDSFKENKISDLKNSKVEKKTILKELEDKIVSLEDVQDRIVSWVEEVNDLSSSIDSTKSKIDFIVKTISSYKRDIDELTKNFINIIDDSELYSELDELRKRKETLVQQREIYNVGIVLLKDTGIKAKIIKQYIPIINQMINKYLDDMEFFCQFTIDETFEEKIKSRYRDDFTFESFSEGEKMRLNLAILFTWRELAKMRNSAATNLLILDEIMDSSLDSSGTEEFIKIIQSLTKKNNVFVISHKTDQIQERFENVIRFEKTKNFSKIVE